MKYTYLLLNLFTVIFPISLSFDRRVHFYKSWKMLGPGILITGLLFLFWDVLFTKNGVWYFNPDYIIGIKIFQLPLEEVLFFLTVPFACLFIYACLNYYVKWEPSPATARIISLCMLVLSVFLVIRYPGHLYTLVTFNLLAVVLVILQLWLKAPWLGRFYKAYLVCLIPFYIINGLLTSVPVVLYNNFQNMAVRVGTIPFEDHFYLMALLLMNTAFYEYFRHRWTLVH